MKKIVSNLSAALLVGALVFTTSCKKPEATVTPSTATPAIGENVKFSNAETKFKNTVVTYDFGDGSQTTNVVNPSHAYSAAGKYTVSVEFKHAKSADNKGKITWATADINVTSVTATITAKDANGVDATSALVGQTISLASTNDMTTATQWPVSYSWYANGVATGMTGQNANWTTTATGKYTIKLKATQGNTSTWSNEITITVGGQNLATSELQAMIGGKWNLTSTASYAGYGGTCGSVPSSWVNTVSSFYLNSTGSSTWYVDASTGSAGNLNSGGGSIIVINATTVSVSGLGLASGLYTTTVSGSTMTLTMVDKSAFGSCSYTDTYTATLNR